jgi:hypothetical protein
MVSSGLTCRQNVIFHLLGRVIVSILRLGYKRFIRWYIAREERHSTYSQRQQRTIEGLHRASNQRDAFNKIILWELEKTIEKMEKNVNNIQNIYKYWEIYVRKRGTSFQKLSKEYEDLGSRNLYLLSSTFCININVNKGEGDYGFWLIATPFLRIFVVMPLLRLFFVAYNI